MGYRLLYETTNSGVSTYDKASSSGKEGLCFGQSCYWAILMERNTPPKDTNPEASKMTMKNVMSIQDMHESTFRYLLKEEFDTPGKEKVQIRKSVLQYKINLEPYPAREPDRLIKILWNSYCQKERYPIAKSAIKAGFKHEAKHNTYQKTYLIDIGPHIFSISFSKSKQYYFDPNIGLFECDTIDVLNQVYLHYMNLYKDELKKYRPKHSAFGMTLL